MRKATIIITLTLFCFTTILAQQGPSNTFSQIDSFVKTVKYKSDIYSLTNRLVSPYSKDILKARAIFKWITENIRYDYKYYNRYPYKGKEPKTYKCKDDDDCRNKKIVWETKYIQRVLRRKKGVCAGYAMLFKKMCDIAGLKAEVIPGYVRTEYYQVGTAGTLDHAWNAVWIDSAYHLLDATWAAGGCARDEDGKLLFYHKQYNDYYWLTSPEDFVRNHYPENGKWDLISNYTKENFHTNPYYAPNEINNIKLIIPASGIINVKKGDTIHFKIDYAGSFEKLQINSSIFRNPDIWFWDYVSKRKKILRLDTSAIRKQQYINYKREGSLYEFEYVASDYSLSYVDILFDRQRLMRFKVNVTK